MGGVTRSETGEECKEPEERTRGQEEQGHAHCGTMRSSGTMRPSAYLNERLQRARRLNLRHEPFDVVAGLKTVRVVDNDNGNLLQGQRRVGRV